MPRVALTAEQRRRQRRERQIAMIADRLAAFKRREHLTDKQLGAAFGLSDRSISKLLDERPVMMTQETFLDVLETVGIEVRQRPENLE